MTEKHTPTPWRVEDCVIYWNDKRVAIALERDVGRGAATYNAAHIVKCVNMHDELVEALKDISRITKGDVSLDSNTSSVARLNHVISLASEALKKAGAL